MGTTKMGIRMMLTLTGAILAYLIGAGFASGQEIMQFFSGWGSIEAPFIIGVISFILMYSTYTAYAYVGRTRGIADVQGIFEFYSGKTVSKFFMAFVWMYNFGCYVFMVSGFANTMHQQWGLAIPVGGAIAVVLSVGTAVLGLKKMVDIIGAVGPIIVGFSLFLGVVSAFHYYPLIAEGNAAINSGEVPVVRAGANVILSGLSYAGCCLLLVSAFIGRLGNDLRGYKFSYTKLILCGGSLIYIVCCIVLGLNHIGNIRVAASTAIPNLLLANNIFGHMDAIFAVIILGAVYSTMCPIIWTCVSTLIKDEKSLKYKLACVIGGISIYLVTLFIPYQTLLNKIMTYGGLCGAVTAIVCTVQYCIIRARDKREGFQDVTSVATE